MIVDYLKTVPQYLFPKRALTLLAGRFADVQVPWIKDPLIRAFISKYGVNMSDALIEDPTQYVSFNEFFIRRLKPSCRPIAKTDLVSPVDGVVSEIGSIHSGRLIQAKGHDYSVQALLGGDDVMSAPYDQGCFTTLYLSPKDYHRVHMPMAGTLSHMVYIPGSLFSVQPSTVRVIPQLFARNERLVVFFNTKIGPMAMVLVGATIVGAIGTSWHGDVLRSRTPQSMDYSLHEGKCIELQQAAEMGYFKLGSTVVLLFADGKRVRWEPGLKGGASIQFGAALGSFMP